MGVRNKKCEKLKRLDSKTLVFSPESQYEQTNTIILFFVIITSETNLKPQYFLKAVPAKRHELLEVLEL